MVIQHPESKEQKIVEAAWKLFDRHGYRKVTMLDIAEASGMSRPTLYASFANKEAILTARIKTQCVLYDLETKKQLAIRKTLREKLEGVFNVWIIEPFASVIDSENGTELLSNISTYVPAAVDDLYSQFETYLVEVLLSVKNEGELEVQDLAHIMMLATKGLKSSTETLTEFERMIKGLITMSIATLNNN